MTATHLLDTGPLTALLNGNPAVTALAGSWVTEGQAATSLLVYGEVVEYLRSRPVPANSLRGLHTLLVGVRPFGLNLRIMERDADLRRSLRPPFGPGLIGDIDTVIAATALEHGLTVVTMDSDFRRVPGLALMVIPRKP